MSLSCKVRDMRVFFYFLAKKKNIYIIIWFKKFLKFKSTQKSMPF